MIDPPGAMGRLCFSPSKQPFLRQGEKVEMNFVFRRGNVVSYLRFGGIFFSCLLSICPLKTLRSRAKK